MGSNDAWYLYPLRGFIPKGDGWTLEDRLWSDATIVSKKFVRNTVEEAELDDDGREIAEFELGPPEQERVDLPKDVEHETRRFASFRSSDAFIAIIANDGDDSEESGPKRRERALDIAAALGLTMSRDDIGEKVAVHDQPRSRIGPIYVKLRKHGQFQEIRREWPGGTGVGVPRVCLRTDFQRSYEAGATIEFEDVPFKWAISKDTHLVRILTISPRRRTDFEELIAKTARFLFETFHRLSNDEKLTRFVTVLEMLLGGGSDDGSWKNIRRRATFFAADAGIPWFHREGIEEVFNARNRLVHEGEPVDYGDVQTARRLSRDFLFHVAGFAENHTDLGSFYQELMAQERLWQVAERFHDRWSDDQKQALNDVIWGDVFDSE